VREPLHRRGQVSLVGHDRTPRGEHDHHGGHGEPDAARPRPDPPASPRLPSPVPPRPTPTGSTPTRPAPAGPAHTSTARTSTARANAAQATTLTGQATQRAKRSQRVRLSRRPAVHRRRVQRGETLHQRPQAGHRILRPQGPGKQRVEGGVPELGNLASVWPQ
jgi:hypothetical protein